MIPAFPPVEQVTAVYLTECLFGIAFNRLVEWAHAHHIWNVSLSVVMGVSVTLLIPVAAWYAHELQAWQFALLLFGCFAFSGAPMVVGSTRREIAERESHHRRPWPTAAAQARDDAIMALSALAARITGQQIRDVEIVNQLHQVIGTLKSV